MFAFHGFGNAGIDTSSVLWYHIEKPSLTGCRERGTGNMKEGDQEMYEREFVGIAPDYSKQESWLARPEKPSYPADIIYLYPSACMDPASPVICPIDDSSMVQGAIGYLAQQASVFDGVGNLFAPYWRQVNGPLLAGMSFEEVDDAEWREPRTDVYASLDYYFQHLNHGRPFILAGSSQGSRLLGMVLGEYMQEHPDYYKGMICAYRLGDSLTRPYLEKYPHVKAAQGEEDLGVCISWNTEGPENDGHPSLVVAPEAIAINPLNWKTDETPASEELCMGCLFPHIPGSELEILEEKVSTVLNVNRGVVVVTNPEMAKYSITQSMGEEGKYMEPLFGPCSYHNCDYSFFYYNIRENAKKRVNKWFQQASDTCKIL